MVKWLYEDKGRNGCANALIEAAENGHLEVVQWLHKNIDMQFKGSETTCMMRAAGNGHLEVLKWFHQRHSNVCRSVVMDSAAGAGHLHVTQWLLENSSEYCSPNGIWRAASTGNMAMLRWLNKHFSSNFTARAMDRAAGNNQLEVVKWLHENRSEGCTTQAMDNAALNGVFETIKWLQANRTEGCSRLAMDWAARNGHLHVVRWLHENRSEGCTIGAMNEAERRGHLKVVRFLYENRTEGCSDGVLEDAAWAGYLEMVQYLDDKTQQRAHWWGLGDASKRRRLELLRILLKRSWKGVNALFRLENRALVEGFHNEVLDELLSQSETKMPAMENEILESLERIRGEGRRFYPCVTSMLDIALQRGCRRIVRRFLDCQDRRRTLRYVKAAKSYDLIVLLRWMVENSVHFDTDTAARLAYQGYMEVTRFLCEVDRVAVLSTLLLKRGLLWPALWILNNTKFTEISSRVAISKAVNDDASIARYFCEHVNDETRSWCFPCE